VDQPLAETPPRLIAAEWDGEMLTLKLDRLVTGNWIEALQRLGSYSAVLGKPPQIFSFVGDQASVPAAEHEIQMVVDNFKSWLPAASRQLKADLEGAARTAEAERRAQLARERDAEARRLRVNRNIKI
jgi:hypothetical protein